MEVGSLTSVSVSCEGLEIKPSEVKCNSKIKKGGILGYILLILIGHYVRHSY